MCSNAHCMKINLTYILYFNFPYKLFPNNIIDVVTPHWTSTYYRREGTENVDIMLNI